MCDCKPGKLCKYHWVNRRMRQLPSLTRKAIDFDTTDKGPMMAISDIMLNYDPDRMAYLQRLHKAGET